MTMADTPNLGYAFGLEPREAVAYFERLGYQVTDDWHETAEAVRGKAFAAAKSGSLDILKDLKAGLIHAAKTGETEASFIERMTGVLDAKAGTKPARAGSRPSSAPICSRPTWPGAGNSSRRRRSRGPTCNTSR